MSQITVKVPASVVRQAEQLAQRDDIPLDQFVALAMAEKISSLLTVDYIRERAQVGSLKRFRELLSKVPSVDPDQTDLLESPDGV